MGNRILEGDNEGYAVMGHFWVYSLEGMRIAVVPFYNGSEKKAREFCDLCWISTPS
jgi:hypothetical protein